MPRRTKSFDEIAEVIGVAAAVSLAHRFGGTRVHIPTYFTNDHWLVDAIGRGPAEKLCAAFTRCNIDIPLGPADAAASRSRRRFEAVRTLTTEGLSAKAIAKRCGMTQRNVTRIRSLLRQQASA